MGDVEGTRRRIVRAAYACVVRSGIAATTLDAAAHEAGVARATVYRHFPGGRDELIDAVVTSEVAASRACRARARAAPAGAGPGLVPRSGGGRFRGRVFWCWDGTSGGGRHFR